MRGFEWVRPGSLREALQILANGRREVVPLAGGSDLLERMKDGLDHPRALLPISHLAELSEIGLDGGTLVIGAAVTLAEVASSQLVGEHAAVLATTCQDIGSVQIRNVATLAGNLLQAPRCPYYRSGWLPAPGLPHPGFAGESRYAALFEHDVQPWVHPSDGATVLAAIGAEVEITAANGIRRTAVADLLPVPTVAHRLPAVLGNSELITAIRVPPIEAGVFLKVRERAMFDFSLVSVCAVRRGDGAQLALGGVAPRPRLVPEVAAMMGRGEQPAAIAKAALHGARPLPGNAYKVPMARHLVERALERLGVVR